MRALAEFIMRGRANAAVVAAVGNLLPLLSPATVALVTLRQGANEGLLVLLWALLPVLVMMQVSPVDSLLLSAAAGGIAVTWVAAWVLRLSQQWHWALLALVAAGAVATGLVGWLLQPYLAAFTEDMRQALAASDTATAEQQQRGQGFVLGLLAYLVALNGLFSLVVGRWWQALLYNPGGFREEFHQLRLKPQLAALLVAGVVPAMVVGGDWAFWGSVLSLPLLVAATGFMHWLVAQQNRGGHWLVFYYLALLLFPPFSVLMVAVGFADSWLDLRARTAGRPPRD